jgi:tetratricopeptide (TPR) repeat protein
MLFDLRGRGRRRTVQIIYLALAVLMGGGLVFFGIGGGVSGGLLDAFKGGGGSSDVLAKQDRALVRRVRLNSADAAGWASLARLRNQEARLSGGYDPTTGRFTHGARRELAKAATAWERYLALNPPSPDVTLAALMVQAFAPGALNQPAGGVQAAEIVAAAHPAAQTYFQLAEFAYAAGQNRKAQLAGQKALSLTPKASRATVRAELALAKQQHGFVSATTAAGSAGTAPPTGH